MDALYTLLRTLVIPQFEGRSFFNVAALTVSVASSIQLIVHNAPVVQVIRVQ
jgi:hypothetical protein